VKEKNVIKNFRKSKSLTDKRSSISTSTEKVPITKNGSKVVSPTSVFKLPVARKSLLERLKESAHIADHHSAGSHPPPLYLAPEVDVTVIDGSKIDNDDDDRDIDDEKLERTSKIHSHSIDQTYELDVTRLTQEDLVQGLPGEISKDKDEDTPTRQDSAASYHEM